MRKLGRLIGRIVAALLLWAILGLIGWLTAGLYGYSEGAAGSIGVAMRCWAP